MEIERAVAEPVQPGTITGVTNEISRERASRLLSSPASVWSGLT